MRVAFLDGKATPAMAGRSTYVGEMLYRSYQRELLYWPGLHLMILVKAELKALSDP